MHDNAHSPASTCQSTGTEGGVSDAVGVVPYVRTYAPSPILSWWLNLV